jgi:hypothetical protein
MVYGPDIICRHLCEVHTFKSKRKDMPEVTRRWQYNSRSDLHSKVTSWAIMFDLMRESSLLRQHVQGGRVGFGINLTMENWTNKTNKDMDLVICTPHAGKAPATFKSKVLGRPIATFTDLAEHNAIALEPIEAADLSALPVLNVVGAGVVLIALEAKAAMTEFGKAESRLYSELDSSLTVINGHEQSAIASALVMVNIADSFVSSDFNAGLDFSSAGAVVSRHPNQPRPAQGVIDRVTTLPRRSNVADRGFDAIGIVVVDMKNDGSPCRLVTAPPAPGPTDGFNYTTLVQRVSALYASRFNSI